MFQTQNSLSASSTLHPACFFAISPLFFLNFAFSNFTPSPSLNRPPLFIMKIIQLGFVCFLTPLAVLGSCTEGVLKCNTDLDHPKPSICDYSNFYRLNSQLQTCEKKVVEGCEIPSFDDSPCILCQEQKILDPQSTKCVDIASSKKKDNCLRYDLTGNGCAKCATGFWISGGTCLALRETLIPNCEFYKSATECSSCYDGFRLVENACVGFASLEGCFLHTDRSCTECESGYILTGNSSTFESLNHAFFTRFLTVKTTSAKWSDEVNASSLCVQETVSNCDQHETFNSCKICQTGYFLNSKKMCEKNPEQPIPYCSVYQSASVCVKCDNTHYLSANACQPVTQVEHCHTFAASENKCQICEPGYFGNSAGDSCSFRTLPSISQCAELNLIADECSACDPKYSLTQNNQKCFKDIENCKNQDQSQGSDPNETSHTCTLCLPEFYLIGNNRCMPSNIPKCKQHASNENKCEICELTFYPNNAGAECAAQNLPNCLSYTTNTNECQDCESDHYITNSKTCEPKSITGCIQYAEGDTNTCAKCESHRYLASSNSLCNSVLFKDNCHYSDGLVNACSECKANFYMNPTLNACYLTRVQGQYDSNCDGNTLTTKTTGCTRCKTGFSLLQPTNPSTTFQAMTTDNCAAINSTTGQCSQCEPTFQLTSSFACQLNSSHATLLCAQLTDGTVGNLSTNTNCAQCRDFISDFLDGGVCKPRTHISANSDCADIDEDSDSICLACAEDKLPVIPEVYTEQIIPQCLLTSSLGFTPSVARCDVYYSDGTCATCQHGFVWDNNTSSCTSSNNAVVVVGNVIWDNHMNIIGKNNLPSPTVSGCNKWAQAGVKEIICIGCNSGLVPVIDEPQAGDSSIMSFSTVRVDNGGNVNYDGVGLPAVQYCMSQASQFRIGVNSNHVPYGSCLWGIKKANYSDYACQKCIYGKVGVLYNITHTSSNLAVSSSFKAVGHCTDDIPGAELLYLNIDYEIRLVPNRVRWSSYLEQTNCTGGKYLVIHAVTSIKDPLMTFTNFDYTDPNSTIPLQDCISSVFIDSNLVNNCLMYALHEDFSANVNYSSLQAMTNFKCIACEPGHQSTLDSEGEYIEACTAITDCDQTASNNTWMGACQTPSNTGWQIEEVDVGSEKMEMIAYHSPVSSGDAISNCIVVDVGRSECRMCEHGYILSNGACVTVSSQIANCHTISIGEAFSNLSETNYSPFQFNNFAFIRVPASNTNAMDSNIINCIDCGTTRTLVIDKTTPSKVYPLKENGDVNDTVCKTPLIGHPTRGTPPEGCLYPKFSDSTQCYKCQLGFTLNVTDFTCVNHTLHLHCVTLETLNNVIVCKECAKSHYLDDSKNCQNRRCEYFENANSTNCALCKNNYIPEPGFPDRCKLNPNRSTDPCDNYSPTLDHCVKCDDVSKIPFLYYLNNVLVSMQCHPFPTSISDQYGVKEIFMKIKYDSAYSTSVPELGFLSSENSTPRVYTQVPSLGHPHDQHCFEYPTVDNCDSQGMGHGGVCFKCKLGYYLSDFNTCTEVIIHDCIDFSPRSPTCEKCADSHYLAKNKTICSNRVQSKDCPATAPESDTCTSCHYSSHYLDPADSLCKPITATGCNLKSKVANVCLSCLDSFWAEDVQGGVACNSYTAEHCLAFANNKDECVSCKIGFWKGSSHGKVICNDFTVSHCDEYKVDKDECQTCDDQHWMNVIGNVVLCENYTAQNCDTYKPDNNECLTCKQGFYKNNLKCEPVTPIERCQIYSIDLNACSECQFESYLKSATNECPVNPDGIKFCDVYSARDVCSRCQTGYYFENAKCLEVTLAVDGCSVYSSATQCLECQSGKFLKNSACVEVTAQNCLTLESESRCATCAVNFLVNAETGNCEDSGISDCVSPLSGSPNTCTKCAVGKLLSENGLTCDSPSSPISNCLDYETETKCKTCESNFLLSADGSACSELTNKAGAHCAKGSFVTSPICDVCHLGYVKTQESLCVKYEDEFCLYKNESDLKCNICKPGSHMDEKGECVGPIEPEEPTVPVESKSVEILNRFSMLFLLLFFNHFLSN